MEFMPDLHPFGNSTNMKTILPGFFQAGDLNEIIFANRNKQYGAYELRKNYNQRLAKAGVITFTTVLCTLFSLSMIFKNGKDITGVVPDIPDFPIPQIFTVEKPIPPAPEPVQRPTSNTTIPLIVDSIPEAPIETDTTSTVLASASSSGNPGSVISPIQGGSSSEPISAVVDSSAGKDKVIMYPEIFPSFPGGQRAFARFLQRNFSCDGNQIRGGEGKITLSFVVTRDGSLESMKVLRENTGIDCVEELLQVMRKSPKWNPGLQNNEPVNVRMILPVTVQHQ